MRRIHLIALTVVALATPVEAQSPPVPAPPAQGSTPAPTSLEPAGFDYKAEGRRDPFVSLVRRGADAGRGTPGSRPPGLAGLETAEVTLRGTMQSRDGYVAMLAGADNKTYVVRVGDRLLDGTVRTITQNAIVILQQVNDPLSLEKQREVRKTIRQADEAR